MSMRFARALERIAFVGLAISLLVFALACALPAAAFAGDIQLTEVYIQNSTGDEARATHCPDTCAHFAELSFSKNVSYYPVEDDRSTAQEFIQDNIGRVHLQKADGTEVVDAMAYMYRTEEYETGQIYVDYDGWLEPDTEYQLVVDAGLRTWDGENASTNPYVVKFRTNDQLPLGIGLHTLVFCIIAAVLLIAGIAVACRRRKKENARLNPGEVSPR